MALADLSKEVKEKFDQLLQDYKFPPHLAFMRDRRGGLTDCIFMVSKGSDAHDSHHSVVIWDKGRIVTA